MPRPARRPALALHADLLRALDLAGGDQAAAERMASLLDFHPRPRPAASGHSSAAHPAASASAEDLSPTPKVPTPVQTEAPAAPVEAAGVLQASLVAVTHITQRPPAADEAAPAGPGLTLADCQPRDAGPPPAPTPLVTAAALWPALRRSVSHPIDAGLDLPALTRALAGGRSLRRLPRRQRLVITGQLWVLQDSSERLQPYQADFASVVDHLLRLRGDQGMTLWTFRGLPGQTLERADSSRVQPWGAPLPASPAGLRLLLLSDLGALAPGRTLEQAWAAQLRDWRRAGAEVTVWSPTARQQVPGTLAALVPIQCLSGGSGLRRQRGSWSTEAQRQQAHQRLQPLLERLQVLASVAVELQPEVLRHLRLLQADLAAEPALEALFWQSTEVERSQLGRPLRAAAAARCRPQLAALPPALQAGVLTVLMQHHAHAPRATEAGEVQLWQAHASAQARALPQVEAPLRRGALWWQRLWDHVRGQGPYMPGLRSFARDMLSRQAADTGWQQACGQQAALLLACAGDVPAQVLPHVPPQLLLQAQRMAAGRPASARWRLLQRGAQLWAWPAGQALPPRASPLTDLVCRGPAVLVGPAPGPRPMVELGEAGGPVLAVANVVYGLKLDFESATVVLSRVWRPAWALELGRDPDGLYALAPTPWGATVRLQAQPAPDGLAWVPVHATAGLPAAAGAEAGHGADASLQVGADARFGLQANLVVHGVLQRLRWLPPGEFWMGSPDDEPGRVANDGPRHRVRLTHGFWLADTACTQALWLALMGSNPAHFQGDLQRPVERVSFDDVLQFLQRLQPLLPPGCQPALPTEAEWEYACRAGAETAFHFGPTIDRSQVNFNAPHDMALALRGEESRTTVPVKSLPPNNWGLYEMHGNVWEWCDDFGRAYPQLELDQVTENPEGHREQGPEARRTVRGGAWLGRAHDARSASRFAGRRSGADGSLGFRFALRAASQQAPEGWLAPEAAGDPAGPAGRPGREAWRDRLRRLFGSDDDPPAPPGTKRKP